MSRDKAIVLLSGGMDSAVALYWAAREYEIAAIMNLNYGQHGADLEAIAAAKLLGALKAGHLSVNEHLGITRISVVVPVSSALTDDMPIALTTQRLDSYGQPMTFVPGRNLIFISYATAMAYDLNAKYIIGGWSSMDVDYPDCSPEFLGAVGVAASYAIGRSRQSPPRQGLFVKSPVSYFTKTEIVLLGEELGVPWELTRSCYAGDDEPCLDCESCILRVRAFIDAGVRDPLVHDDAWATIISVCAHDLGPLSGVVELDNAATS